MLPWVDAILIELLFFASAGFLVGGLDDLAIDLIWIARTGWRQLFIVRRHPPASLASLPPPRMPGRIAVMICAWREQAVIGEMLRTALARFDHSDYRLYVGTYPNDPATQAEVRAIADPRVRLVVGPRDGPSTKGDNLNHIWAAIRADEQADGTEIKAVLIHDAEDVVHSAELALFDRMIERFDVVQIPVLPLVDPCSRWIAGHYCDEFAEAHRRTLAVREWLGAGLPLAGVGCAIARTALIKSAAGHGGLPFDAESVTEDYELGLRLGHAGCRGAFVSLPALPGGSPIAVRALFPVTPARAVRQKARWVLGIALAGWDRLGWQGRLAERWMRLRDRRALLAALLLLCAYLALLLTPLAALGHRLSGTAPPALPPTLKLLLGVNLLLFGWRGLMRWRAVKHHYGAAKAWRALLRIPVSNGIAILAARRALGIYLRHLRGQPLDWQKTRHAFPTTLPAE